MARYVYRGKFVDKFGHIVTSGTVSVFLATSATPASIYAAVSGGVAVNSVTGSATDSTWTFYVDDTDYAVTQKFDVVLSKTGYVSQTYPDISPWGFPQDIRTSATPTFASMTGSGLTASLPVFTDANKVLVSKTASQARSALSVEYITTRVNIKDRGAVLDGATNDLTVIQTCRNEVFALGGGTVFIPPSQNGAYIGSKLVIDNNYVCLEGIESEKSIILSDQNIVMIEVGHYVYSGANNFSGDNVYGSGIKNLHIKNTAVTKTNTIGVNLLSSAYSDYHNIHIDGCRTGIVVQVIGGWLKIKNMLIEGTGLVYGARVSGTGYSAGYNTTGLEFSGISAIGYTGAGFSCYGNVFGDITVNQLNLYGADANASGISLTSVGSKFYANKITFSVVDVDGTNQYAVFSDGVSNLTVTGLAIGGAVTYPWSIIGGSNNMILSNLGIWMGTQSPGDPSAPPTGGILYLRDNGGGKMQYVAIFPTGVVQVIATEP